MRLIGLFGICAALVAADLPSGIRFYQGSSANTVIIGNTAIYGAAPKAHRILLTHARRDITAELPANAEIIVPAAERELFENPQTFWTALEIARFHDYAQQSTKVPVTSLKVTRAVSDGDTVQPGIRVVATPGYTRGSVSYLIETGGKRVVCTGDLIYGEGQLFDLYSLQDAVPEAKARGYHGYAARAGDLIASLRKVAALKPDILLPARGPAIAEPQAAIGRLIERLQTFLASHFETDALRWYWGDDNHRIRSRAVERTLNVMPMGEEAKLPPDVLAIGNSRVILSRSGAAFLVDAGYRNLLAELQKLKISRVEGTWITHYHDDHTDYINDVVNTFRSPVYFTDRMSEVIEKPGFFRLPCLTNRAVTFRGGKRDGATMRWNEWEFTFLHFPGQTLYHGGLVAKRDDGQTYLFVGDSFTPSGMDDYCMQNRVFLRQGEGYDYCLRKIASLPLKTWLINQHVAPMFRYTAQQIGRMQDELTKRSAALAKLSPWPDINYMVDESWARIHPYGSEVKSGEIVELQMRIMNHAPDRLTYRTKWNLPSGWKQIDGQTAISIPARQEGTIKARVRAGAPGLHVITADVAFAGRELKQWTESLVRVR